MKKETRAKLFSALIVTIVILFVSLMGSMLYNSVVSEIFPRIVKEGYLAKKIAVLTVAKIFVVIILIRALVLSAIDTKCKDCEDDDN